MGAPLGRILLLRAELERALLGAGVVVVYGCGHYRLEE